MPRLDANQEAQRLERELAGFQSELELSQLCTDHLKFIDTFLKPYCEGQVAVFKDTALSMDPDKFALEQARHQELQQLVARIDYLLENRELFAKKIDHHASVLEKAVESGRILRSEDS